MQQQHALVRLCLCCSSAVSSSAACHVSSLWNVHAMHLQMTGVDSTGGGGARLVADTGGGCRRSLQCVSVLCESRQCAAHRLSESALGQLCVCVAYTNPNVCRLLSGGRATHLKVGCRKPHFLSEVPDAAVPMSLGNRGLAWQWQSHLLC